MTVPFRYDFLSLLYDFLKFNFSHFTAQVKVYFVEKGNPTVFGFENGKEEWIQKTRFRETLNCT